jgi:hypothetical protein
MMPAVAWTSVDKANFLGGSRRSVTSVSGSLRVNLLGFTLAQISYVHPNDRPPKGWMWGIQPECRFLKVRRKWDPY